MTWNGVGIQLRGDNHCCNQTGARATMQATRTPGRRSRSIYSCNILVDHLVKTEKSQQGWKLHVACLYLALLWATRTPRVEAMFAEATSGTPPINAVTFFTAVCIFVPPVGSVFCGGRRIRIGMQL